MVSTLCVGEQCAEAEPLKYGSRGDGEAPPSLQVTSSALVFDPQPWDSQNGEASKPMHSQPLPLAPAGLHIFYLCSLEKKWLVAMFLLAVM